MKITVKCCVFLRFTYTIDYSHKHRAWPPPREMFIPFLVIDALSRLYRWTGGIAASPFPNGTCKVRHIGKSGIDSPLSIGVCYTPATKIVQTPLVTEDTAHIQMKGPEFLRGILKK